MSKRVLIINGNPKSTSFCGELVARYKASSEENNEVNTVHLSELNFESDLFGGYEDAQPVEPDLKDVKASILWAEHIVLVLPVWWGGMPAKLKGLIDRTFLPGFAFKYVENKAMPEKLLKGRTSDIILTMDTPPFYYRWVQGNPIVKQLKRTTLEFCGIKVKSVSYLGPLLKSTPESRDKWLNEVATLASKT